MHKINSTHLFNNSNRTLTSLNGNNLTISLSKYSSRVLNFLILNAGDSISREKLLSSIWEYDFATNASLNNYISEIRKAFDYTGLDRSLIDTIPRYGFIFKGQVEAYHELGRDNKKSKATIIFHLTMIAMIILLTIMFILIRSINKDEAFTLTPLYHDGTCSIYSMSLKPVNIQYIKKILRDESVNCNSIKRDIFYYEGGVYNNVGHSKSITICDKIDEDKYAECVNLKRAYDQ